MARAHAVREAHEMRATHCARLEHIGIGDAQALVRRPLVGTLYTSKSLKRSMAPGMRSRRESEEAPWVLGETQGLPTEASRLSKEEGRICCGGRAYRDPFSLRVCSPQSMHFPGMLTRTGGRDRGSAGSPLAGLEPLPA